MNTSKQNILHLSKLCVLHGIEDVVISPGSRNAPLMQAFLNEEKLHCVSVIDERSAAFVALGMAQKSGKAVAVCCTSGSAVLNFAPAIAEAFYQKIPLIIITADRPNEWIDQGENQSINQYNIYQNYIRKSVELPVNPVSEEDLWFSNRLVSEAINCAQGLNPGPVHINVPLREPLYEMQENPEVNPKIIRQYNAEPKLASSQIAEFQQEINRAQKIWIIAGMNAPSSELSAVLEKLLDDKRCILLTESISNLKLQHAAVIENIDAPIEVIKKNNLTHLLPDLVISFGNGMVSKKLKFLLREQKMLEHWHLSASAEHIDTFRNLSKVICATPQAFFSQLIFNQQKSPFQAEWCELNKQCNLFFEKYLQKIKFSDFHVFQFIHQQLNAAFELQLGNSTPIRYANLFSWKERKNAIFCNRGVSGIDGCLSTAIGSQIKSQQPTLCILGDLSFMYDSNALHITENHETKVIVLNNSGGNIFKIIPGPDKIKNFENFMLANHPYHFKGMVNDFAWQYYFCSSANDLKNIWQNFIEDKNKAVLEIKTEAELSAKLLTDYFKSITQITIT